MPMNVNVGFGKDGFHNPRSRRKGSATKMMRIDDQQDICLVVAREVDRLGSHLC